MALNKQDTATPRDASSTQTILEPPRGVAADRARPAGSQRTMWDTIVSGAAAVIAVALIMIGAAAVYGGNFGRQNVQDRLAPEHVAFPPLDSMTPQEQAQLGQFAGQTVDTGPEAEAFARFIGGHLAEVNGGATYSETSAAARAEGLAPAKAAALQVMADTLFKGETLRSILLNAYGWWTVSTIALFVGFGLIVAGLVLGFLSILGFRHARRAGTSRAVQVA